MAGSRGVADETIPTGTPAHVIHALARPQSRNRHRRSIAGGGMVYERCSNLDRIL
jgi:hypothetical protein